MYYSSIGMLSLAVHLIVNYSALNKQKRSKNLAARERYRSFLYAVTIYYITDILWGYFYGNRWVIPTFIDTTIYFMSMVVSVLLWTRFVVSYLENEGWFGKILLYSGWSIFSYELIALIINLFIPVVFGFDENKEYIPGQARYLTLVIQVGLFLMTSVYALLTAVKEEGDARAHHRTVGFSGIMMTVFIALQTLYPLLPFYAAGCLLATSLIHSFVYKDQVEEHSRELEQGKQIATRDPLTGVKNKLAYIENLVDIEKRVEEETLKNYGVVVFDVNGLKIVNDTLGHDAGDEYIKSACRLICVTFKHSPVYRVGGDEFVAILEGDDYENRTALLKSFDDTVEENKTEGRVVVAGGLAIYDAEIDEKYSDVFKRADTKMYERKKQLKQPA